MADRMMDDADGPPRGADLRARAFDGLVNDLARAAPELRRFGAVALFRGDNAASLDIVRARIDALVADPPYGIGYVGGGGSHKFAGVAIAGDDRHFDPSPFLHLAPRTCLWGANHFAARLPASPGWLVWDKRCGAKPMDQADCELAWTDQRRPARLKNLFWSGAHRGWERGEHWHPTQKSVDLMAWCLDQLQVPPGGIVFDPFMGSGTTAIACMKTGRRFIGVELEARWFEAAVARVSAEDGQGRLCV